jgi:hypothetical protein
LVSTVRDLLDAIRALPGPDRLRLVEQLATELGDEGTEHPVADLHPAGPDLELRNGFFVFTGRANPADLEHRAARDERIERLARLAIAGRD